MDQWNNEQNVNQSWFSFASNFADFICYHIEVSLFILAKY